MKQTFYIFGRALTEILEKVVKYAPFARSPETYCVFVSRRILIAGFFVEISANVPRTVVVRTRVRMAITCQVIVIPFPWKTVVEYLQGYREMDGVVNKTAESL